MARTPDSTALLDAWEAALCEPASVRAPSLLLSLDWLDSPEALAGSTIGQTDCLLFELRNLLFGPTLECVSVCGSCAQTVEFAISTADIVPAASSTGVAGVELLD